MEFNQSFWIGSGISTLITLLFVLYVFGFKRKDRTEGKQNDLKNFSDNNDNNNNEIELQTISSSTTSFKNNSSVGKNRVLDAKSNGEVLSPRKSAVTDTTKFEARRFAVLCEPTSPPLSESQRILQDSNEWDDNSNTASTSDDYEQFDSAAWIAEKRKHQQSATTTTTTPATTIALASSLTASQKLDTYGYYEAVEPVNEDDNEKNGVLKHPLQEEDEKDDVASVASGCGKNI